MLPQGAYIWGVGMRGREFPLPEEGMSDSKHFEVDLQRFRKGNETRKILRELYHIMDNFCYIES